MSVLRSQDIALVFALGVLSGCAAQTKAAQEDHCGNLPPQFKPPFVCPHPAEQKRLRVEDMDGDSGCFIMESGPGEHGGLRIPRQIVCPPAGKPSGGKQ